MTALPHEATPPSVANFELFCALSSPWAVVIDWLEDVLPLASLLVQEGAHGGVHQIDIQDYT